MRRRRWLRTALPRFSSTGRASSLENGSDSSWRDILGTPNASQDSSICTDPLISGFIQFFIPLTSTLGFQPPGWLLSSDPAIG